MRKVEGEWKRSFWPLAVMCAPEEDLTIYKKAFTVLKEVLAEYSLPEPQQMHTDWHQASKAATLEVFPKARLRRSLQHMRRNLAGKGERPPIPRPKDAARRTTRKPRATPFPHLRGRSIWAFLHIHSQLIWAPTLSMFHCCMDAVLKRAKSASGWANETWAGYLEKTYLRKHAVNEGTYGIQQAAGRFHHLYYFH